MRTLKPVIDDDEFRTSLDLLVQREGFATRPPGRWREAPRLAEAPDVLVDLAGRWTAWLRANPRERPRRSITAASVEWRRCAAWRRDYTIKAVDRARCAALGMSRTRALKKRSAAWRTARSRLAAWSAPEADLEVYDRRGRADRRHRAHHR
jgi:hypothetical protein